MVSYFLNVGCESQVFAIFLQSWDNLRDHSHKNIACRSSGAGVGDWFQEVQMDQSAEISHDLSICPLFLQFHKCFLQLQYSVVISLPCSVLHALEYIVEHKKTITCLETKILTSPGFHVSPDLSSNNIYNVVSHYSPACTSESVNNLST